MTNNSTFAIIIPTRNERNNLFKLLPILTKLYPQASIWIVDDNSTDGTFVFLKDFSNLHPHVHIFIRQNRHGRGSAVMDGLKEAYKNKKILYFLEMDADLSHSPAEIQKLLAAGLLEDGRMDSFQVAVKMKNSETIIIGSRQVRGSKYVNCAPIRVILSHLANFYIKLILQIPINDYTNGFRLYPRLAVKILMDAKIHENGYIALSETAYILYKKGLIFTEVPTTFTNRKIGRSNTTITEFLKSLAAVLKIRFSYTF